MWEERKKTMTQFFTCYILGGNKLFDKLSDTTKKRKEKQEAKVKEVAALFLKKNRGNETETRSRK